MKTISHNSTTSSVSVTAASGNDQPQLVATIVAYFHERRSLNNFHRDRVITFEQIAE